MTDEIAKREKENPDWSRFRFSFEARRASFFYPHYAMIHRDSHKHKPVWAPSVVTAANFKDHMAEWYFALKDDKEFDDFLERFFKKPGLLGGINRYITKIREETVKKLTKKEIKTISNSELASLSSYYYSQLEEILFAPITFRNIDRAIIPRLKKVFKNANNADELICAISVSDEPSFALKEEIALLTLAAKIVKKKILPEKILNEIEKIKNQYCWSAYGYYKECAKTKEDYINSIRKFKNTEQTLKRLNKEVKNKLEKKEAILKRLKGADRQLAEIAGKSVFLRDYFKSSINEMIFYSERLFCEIARRTNKSPEFIKELLPEETRRILLFEKIDEDAVRERIKHNILIAVPGVLEMFVGKEANEFEERYLKTKTEKQEEEFKGRIASPGSGEGKVKIILRREDFHKLKAGDILVVSNTTPDYVPIIRKAAAIAAEEGGLTAHVSVVSREFGIPCVVGIPHITKILKDNDLVKVDANKGIVKILKKAKN